MKFNYFEDAEHDYIAILMPMFQTRKAYIRDDGKIGIKARARHDTPWLFSVPAERDCTYSHSILYPNFHFIPERCLNCWKVVARPNTVKQLFAIHELQKRLGFPSKCGIETRGYVPGHYGAYWYCDSKEEGLERLKKVKASLEGMNITTYLKRGCTEFELKSGDSANWKLMDGQKEYEAILKDKIIFEDVDELNKKQPDYLIRRVKKEFIEFAHDRGDMTYIEFTGGRLLVAPSHTYGDST